MNFDYSNSNLNIDTIYKQIKLKKRVTMKLAL